MIFLALKDLKPGMVLSTPVHNFHGILLLSKGTKLTQKNIRILKSWGVNHIGVAGRSKKDRKKATVPDKATKRSVQANLTKKFSDVLDDKVMVEIMRVAGNRLKKRSLNKKELNERQ